MKPALSLLVVSLALVVGCVNGRLSPVVAPIVAGIEQAVCQIVPIADPASGVYVGSVCSVAAPIVNGILTSFSARKPAAAPLCHLVPITDGKQGLGVVCDSVCGDMSKATAGDPCPDVDARLRAGK